MIKKTFGVIFLLAGVGNFLGNIAKSQAGRSDAWDDIGYIIFFLCIGAFLMSKKKNNNES